MVKKFITAATIASLSAFVMIGTASSAMATSVPDTTAAVTFTATTSNVSGGDWSE